MSDKTTDKELDAILATLVKSSATKGHEVGKWFGKSVKQAMSETEKEMIEAKTALLAWSKQRERAARIKELESFHIFRTDDGSNERQKAERLAKLKGEDDE